MLLSEGRYVLLLDGADPAPALSKPRSQSEKELAQVPGLLAQLLTRLLSGLFIHSVCFCRSPARGQDGRCLSSSYCACCRVSHKQPSFRACTPRPEPSRLQTCLAGTSAAFSTRTVVRASAWLWIEGVVRSGSEGMREVRAHMRGHMSDLMIAGIFTVLICLCSLPFKLMTESRLHLQDMGSRVCKSQR